MPTEDIVRKSLPSYLRAIVPTPEQIHRALGRQRNSFSVDTTFIRAIDNPSFVGSASPFASHRFGPPVPEFLTEKKRLAFTWLYLALSENVAAWESQFARNNRGAGNGFHITRKAEVNGFIASIRFQRSLKLWNLADDHSSRLGIHDIVSSEDHEACQWLGEVAVRATAYEVTRSTEHGSAFQLALDLLSKGLGLSVQVTGEKLSNAVRIKAPERSAPRSASRTATSS
ncbi:type II secretory pathway protein [Pandoraea aquatica]|uniref:Type II secretory pathway protein n=1 Tax=Pandoraea aquatica TaxID=2508290 RepID=A0A5E4SCP8_9BURK|nr:hypothetical protein [Pandoraea aquatica]VVD71809.1 type II secretory pathway protein [Pandoraea aquatica]